MLWIFSYFVLLAFILIGIIRLFHFPLNLLGLIVIVRETSDADLADLMDPCREAELRSRMSATEFRQEQRARMTRAFEYLRRRLFNALMMVNFAHAAQAELEDTGKWPSDAQAALVQEIIEAGIHYRLYALLATAKLGLWILLRLDNWAIFPIPSLADFREVAKIDGAHAYYRLTTAVGYFSLSYGQECYEVLMLKLRGYIPSQ